MQSLPRGRAITAIIGIVFLVVVSISGCSAPSGGSGSGSGGDGSAGHSTAQIAAATPRAAAGPTLSGIAAAASSVGAKSTLEPLQCASAGLVVNPSTGATARVATDGGAVNFSGDVQLASGNLAALNICQITAGASFYDQGFQPVLEGDGSEVSQLGAHRWFSGYEDFFKATVFVAAIDGWQYNAWIEKGKGTDPAAIAELKQFLAAL